MSEFMTYENADEIFDEVKDYIDDHDTYEEIPYSTWSTYTPAQKAEHPNAIITDAPGGSGGGSGADIKKATYEETTALNNHVVNELIVLIDNEVPMLYKVTDAITIGDTITDEGQNANVTTDTGIGADVQIYVSGIVSGDNVPDGSTVTPTDDVQTLLACAGITDKSYTTLNELLADTTTLQSVISSENAIDYLVRCKDWCGRALVPIMTSNTTPSGECISSTPRSGGEAYKAFNNDPANNYVSESASPDYNWCGYHFSSSVKVKRIKARFRQDIATQYKVQASSDGNTWVDTTAETTVPASSGTYYANVSDSNFYPYWRLYGKQEPTGYVFEIGELQFYSGTDNLCDNQTFMSYIGLNNYASNTLLADADWLNAICDSTYFESVLNVKVPTMTSNTTPSGETFGLPTDSNSWAAFDGTSLYGGAIATPTTGEIGYKFTNRVKIVKVVIGNVDDSAGSHDLKDFNIRVSDDASNWDIVYTGEHPNNANYETYIFNNNLNRQYCEVLRISRYGSTRDLFMVGTIQFYGREDI